MNYRSICIAGVDGTGKSSTIDKLVERLGKDNVCVQYMGSRLWETEIAKKYLSDDPPSGLKKPLWIVMRVYAQIKEMYHRIRKYNNTTKLVIFDRYAYEKAVLDRSFASNLIQRIVAIVDKIFLEWFFPAPDFTFYLTCPLEISISRKSDINTNEEIIGLRINKNSLDKYYGNRRNVMVLDTSTNTQEMIVAKIMKLVTTKLYN